MLLQRHEVCYLIDRKKDSLCQRLQHRHEKTQTNQELIGD